MLEEPFLGPRSRNPETTFAERLGLAITLISHTITLKGEGLGGLASR